MDISAGDRPHCETVRSALVDSAAKTNSRVGVYTVKFKFVVLAL